MSNVQHAERASNLIEFTLFERARVVAFQHRISALSIHEHSPAIVEVANGFLTAGESPGGKMLGVRGACDGLGAVVNSSVALRGERFGDEIEGPARTLLDEAPRDNRSVYYLGDLRHQRSHYGHFLLDTFSRAWNWRARNMAAVPILLGNQVPVFAQAIYDRIPKLAKKLCLVNRTTKFKRITIPSPSFVIDKAAHIQFKDLCGRVAGTVDGGIPTDQPLYLSRAGLDPNWHRTMVGELELEKLLSAEGFLVVRPETLPMLEQIRLFKSHRYVVAGMGSACHTRLFSTSTRLMLVLSPDRLDVNHILCDLLSPGRTNYVNAAYVPELAIKGSLPKYAQPLLLDTANILAILKKMGLLRPTAYLEHPPGVKEYKLLWLQTARGFLERRENDQLRRSIDVVARSLDSGNT